MAYFEKGQQVTQPAPSASAAPAKQPAGAGGSNAFTRKLGPLPVWGWMGIGLAIALVYYFWKQNKAAASSSATTNTATPDQTTAASQIPQFVNEINQTTPPSSTGITTIGNLGSQGPLKVPKVTGMTTQQAATVLNNAGFDIGTGGVAAATGQLPKGVPGTKKVTSQSPGPGTSVGYGTNYWPAGVATPFVDVN